MKIPKTVRHLVLILGDQLDRESSAFVDFDPKQDAVLMIEAREESTHVWSHKIRTALFLSAMRHFAKDLEDRGWPVIYRQLDKEADVSLADGLQAVIKTYSPQAVIAVEPGDWRVRQQLDDTMHLIAFRADSVPANSINRLKKSMQWLPDTHFLCDLSEFRQWAGKSTTLRMEFFYRVMRKKHHILMAGKKGSAEPEGGQWNFDADNRKSFGKSGPQGVPAVREYKHDAITQDVIKLVNKQFADHPGNLDTFNWPVTREQALQALDDFIKLRLPFFGPHQDAMWTHLDFGWHSLLSSSLNLKLLHPLEVIQAAEKCYRSGKVDLPSAEGFIRQILGWREFMRGVYFLDMPQLAKDNFYDHQNALPKWYWTGNTQMNCMKNSIEQTLQNGYSHHIQRLMITGMFGVTAQIKPQALCDWYLAVYVDAVEWVELPNTAGMALFANGGRFTSKPYVASGAYVKRMSNYCQGCAYSPEVRTGQDACPMTVLYWNFLDVHEKEFAGNPRTALMVKNLQRMTDDERKALRARAKEMLSDLDGL
ncbi:cryptochrome/photolyase family protein [Variovorax sp. PCZ-1]|uniref:cryptochrome/photolyase family protein n=1 Tax=Variovorax sp. PCZ-1 TaxID=2835533 RepID=UPI001BD12E7C|nr:cryptochrome/photolyase family protein [Variovorax sp. PCZ-1]MBS7806324.1 cryptochrome/photolyase family protein [Variovorax sp. PCZ-1]